MNGGQCISGKELPITCQCPDSYWGRYCQLSLLPASCDEFFGYFNNDTAKKGIGLEVHLDLDGSGELEPFVVNCSKTTG